MNITMTSLLAATALLFAIVFGWIGARPSRPGRIRMAPWRFFMLLAFTALIATTVHLVSLLKDRGVHEFESTSPITR